MLYNIFFGFPTFPKIEYGVDKAFVEKIVDGYLRGQSIVIIAGRSIKISETNLQIYSIPKELAGERTEVESFFTTEVKRMHGIISEKILVNYCKNVTKGFLLNRGWGDLKDDVYNVYINSNGDKITRTVIEKNELLAFINDWREGLPNGFLSGKVISLENLKTITIYDIEIKHRQQNNGETKKYLNEQVRIFFGGRWGTRALEGFGKDVTSTFNIGAYGSNRKTTQQPTKAIIHELQKIQSGKFFISHSSKDKAIVNKFINEILILCLGVEQAKIFCTSIEGLDINSGEDFRQRIKKELIEAQIVLQIISKGYKASEVCLNEMGAAWVLAEKVIPLLVDGEYDVGFIHNSTQQLKLNKKTDILKLIDDLEHYCPNKSKRAKIEGHIEEFLKLMNGKSSQTP